MLPTGCAVDDPPVPGDDELRRERAYLDAAYDRVVAMRGSAERMAGTARLTETRNAQALFERDSAIAHAGHRLAALDIAKDRLLVGRLDLDDGSCLYVGRVAVADEHGDPLVVDWRAPAAEPFYRALAARPHGRGAPTPLPLAASARWSGWRTRSSTSSAAGEAGLHLVGEGALMAALDAPRTGRMQDVVATIQAEQDVVIRRPRAGVTVVQGAPGTGKTAVALHRAAYLLYAERAHLASAVLFVGPSTTFLRYVEDVVPSLGEDRVVLATPADLGPAVTVSKVDPPAAAAVKGDLRMVDVLARAIRAHERAPRAGIELWAGRFRLVVDHDSLAAIVATARRRSTTHNGGRPFVERLLLRALDAAYHDGLERDLRIGRIGAEAVSYATPLLDVIDRGALAQALHSVWPLLTPEVLVRRLLASPRRIENAGRDVLTTEEVDALHVPRTRRATDGPRPTLPFSTRPTCCSGPSRRARSAPAGGDGRSITSPSGSWRSGCRTAHGAGARSSTGPARRLAAIDSSAGSARSGSPRPRSWVTQPPTSCTGCTRSSPTSSRTTKWRRSARPTRSTATSWSTRPRICRRCNGGRSRGDARHSRSRSQATKHKRSARARRRHGTSILSALGVAEESVARHELTVNYRTPAEVMEVAAGLLERFAPHLHPARSVRTAGVGPRRIYVDAQPLGAATIAAAVADIRREVGAGLVAVISPAHRVAASKGDGEHLTAVDAKGLEFDGVVVVDPEAIVSESPGTTGMARLYVALTRATTRLTILAPTPPGPPLDDVLGPFEPVG